MGIIIAILLYFGVFTWDLATDLAKWKSGVPVNHFWESIVRALLLIPSALLFARFSFKHIPKNWIKNLLLSGFMMASFWWLFFDGLYNHFRGFDFFFNGSVDADDSVLDRFLMNLKDWQEGLLKIGLVAVSTYFYVRKVK